MREIKFRGKRLDNGELVYGYLIGNDVIVGVIVEWDDEYFCTEFWLKVDPETVGQYTGLLDRNGKEIYEGDILRWGKDFHIFVVEWIASETRFGVRNTLLTYCDPDKDSFSNTGICEIIGNIHQNPELINS